MGAEPQNGDRFITWKDWHSLETQITSLIRDAGKEQTAEISAIVGQLNVMSEAERTCRAEVRPIIETYTAIKKWFWGLIATNAGALGMIVFQYLQNLKP